VALVLAAFGVAAWLGRAVVVFARNGVQADAGSAEASRKEIEVFNRKFLAAHLKMDNAAIVGMWAEDGVSLLPETAPMVGKPIAKFMDDVVARMPGYHMRKIEIDFQGIEASGDWPSEWAYERQIVDAPEGKPPFEGYGKMLLALHREAEGNWKVKREMWNQGLKP
jgi:ketosteroid isomerase-like protein